MLTALLATNMGTMVLTRIIQRRIHTPCASPTTLILLTELLKLVTTVLLSLTEPCPHGALLDALKPRNVMLLFPPALMYTLQQNLIFLAMAELEIVVFQMIYQSKLLITAVLSVAFFGTRLSTARCLALVLLAVGVTVTQASGAGAQAHAGKLAPSPVTSVAVTSVAVPRRHAVCITGQLERLEVHSKITNTFEVNSVAEVGHVTDVDAFLILTNSSDTTSHHTYQQQSSCQPLAGSSGAKSRDKLLKLQPWLRKEIYVAHSSVPFNISTPQLSSGEVPRRVQLKMNRQCAQVSGPTHTRCGVTWHTCCTSRHMTSIHHHQR